MRFSDKKPAYLTGETYTKYDRTDNFQCNNKVQEDLMCDDYKVKFCCKCE